MTRCTQLLVAATTVSALCVAGVPTALAHVTVDPRQAEPGSYTKLEFRVPNERADAGTTTVEINLPAEHPIAFVTVRPHPAWTFTAERTPLAEPYEEDGQQITAVVSRITFSGGPIRPGEFDLFEVFAGPLPDDTDELVLPVVQTYDDGDAVRWVEEASPSGERPEHPAPVLQLVDPSATGGDTTTTTGAGVDEDESAGEPSVSNAASQDDVDRSRTLALVALIVGIAGLAAGLTAGIRGRRPGGGARAPAGPP